jgi:hypothetical protein
MTSVWERIVIAFIGSLPATIFAIAALIQSIRTHHLVNSGMAARDNAMRAEGQIQQQDKERVGNIP